MANLSMQRSFAGNVRCLQRAPAPRAAARITAVVSAKERPLWLPGTVAPKHLDGTIPGDNGFDPLGLGVDADRLKWYVEAELTNGRWAMAAAAGILATDLLGLPAWYEAGAVPSWLPPVAQVPILAVVLGFLETKRYEGFLKTGETGLVNSFPFDPLNMKSPESKLKEVKNGRLAMVAVVGFAVQALVTRTGPLENLAAHVSSPFDHTIVNSIASLPQTLA